MIIDFIQDSMEVYVMGSIPLHAIHKSLWYLCLKWFDEREPIFKEVLDRLKKEDSAVLINWFNIVSNLVFWMQRYTIFGLREKTNRVNRRIKRKKTFWLVFELL